MAADSTLYVPVGTVISGPNGQVTTVTTTLNLASIPVGTIINVPASATGPANTILTNGHPIYAVPTPAATVSVVAGSATNRDGPVDGSGTSAIFWGVADMAPDASGNIFVSDRGSLRKVTQAGLVTTLSVAFQPAEWEAIAVDAMGNIYGSSSTLEPSQGSAATWTSSINELTTVGALKNIKANWETSTTDPTVGMGGLVLDAVGNIVLADAINHRIVKFTRDGVMSVFAGSGLPGTSDGAGISAELTAPNGLAIDAIGNLFITDTTNALVRKITPNGTVSTIARLGGLIRTIGSRLGGPIAVDQAGNIYTIAVPSNILCRIDTSGNPTLLRIPELSAIPMGGIGTMIATPDGTLYISVTTLGAQILKIKF